MADKNKTVTEEPVEEPKVDDEPVADVKPDEEPQAEEPKVEEPDSGTAAPTSDAAEPAGTDQQGRQLYSVKCANCGKQTQVPFKPIGDRPVYCRDCYMQKKGGRG
jgi:CxxC-x17-CxxC domain-containing protein